MEYILLAEQDIVRREMMAAMLSHKYEVGVVSDDIDLINTCQRNAPYCIVVNSYFSLAAVESIRDFKKDVRIVMYSEIVSKGLIQKALDLGLNAFLLLHRGFVAELDKVLGMLGSDKQMVLGEGVAEYLTTNNDSLLTDREVEIAGLLVGGKTSREISGMLFISANTVNNHRGAIKKKLNYKNIIELNEMLRLS